MYEPILPPHTIRCHVEAGSFAALAERAEQRLRELVGDRLLAWSIEATEGSRLVTERRGSGDDAYGLTYNMQWWRATATASVMTRAEEASSA